MRRGLAVYAVFAYAFLHVPLLILAVFSFNSSRFAVWQGFSLQWYRLIFVLPLFWKPQQEPNSERPI